MIRGFTWKTAFLRGALLRIQNRLHEQRTAQQQPTATIADVPAAATVTALVLRTDQENVDYIRQHFGELRKGRVRRASYHAGAWQRGNERGAEVSLTPTPGLPRRSDRRLRGSSEEG